MTQLRLILAVILILTLLPGVGSSERSDGAMNPIFHHGEELIYEVAWMGITAGTITMRIADQGNFEGTPAYRAEVVGETTPGFSRFFKVQDVIISIFSKSTLDSIYFSKNIREGKYRKFRETWFDQTKLLARSDSTLSVTLEHAKDPIACIFALRNAPLAEGVVVQLNSHADGKNFPVEIKVERREIVTLASGARSAFLCTPLPTWEGRVFEKGQSTVTLWVSDDEYRVPLKIRMKVKIGSLNADLVGRRGPGWEIAREKPL